MLPKISKSTALAAEQEIVGDEPSETNKIANKLLVQTKQTSNSNRCFSTPPYEMDI